MSIFDKQQNQVYAWEMPHRRKFPKIDPDLVPIVIEMVCDYMEIDEPTLRYNVNMKRKAHYTPRKHRITFPGQNNSWGFNQMVVLHELAHAIHFMKWKDAKISGSQESHGPEFMYYFILLLKKFTKGVDIDALVLDAKRKYGLRIAEGLDSDGSFWET